MEFDLFVAPDVLLGVVARFLIEFDFLGLEVNPGGRVAAADGALAFVNPCGFARDDDGDAAAVAGTFDGIV